MLVTLHLFHQLLPVPLHLLNLILLRLEQTLRLLQFLVLVPESVYLRLQLVRFLLLNHLHVPLGDLLDLAQTAVGEPVAVQGNVDEGRVLVECLQQDGFHVLGEEVVRQLHMVYVLIVLQGVDQVDEASVVQAAGGKIEFLQLGGVLRIRYYIGEVSQDLISQEILVADEGLDVAEGQDVAESLKPSWSDLVERDVYLLQVNCLPETLCNEQ